jgi:hypothetical protein
MSTTTSTISFLVSNKGHRLLVQDGFIYKINKQTSCKIYWTCKSKHCNAHIHTDLNNNFLKSSGEHKHLLEPEQFEVKQFRDIVKERVMNETTPIMKIYDEEILKAKFSPETLASVPLARHIRKIIPLKTSQISYMFFFLESGLNQIRRKSTPNLPTSETFDIPDSYQTTSNGEKFLFCDTLVCRKKRMLLFGSRKQLELLFDSSVLLMDGTFSATPPFFDQVYTLHVLKFDCCTAYIFYFIIVEYSHSSSSGLPCVFGLLPDRKKTTYQELFRELKSVAASINRIFKPERIITDFESSLIPAIRAEVNFH